MVLSLVQVVLEKTEALRLLEEAYDAQSGVQDSRAAGLDSVVEIARVKGFYGSAELAAGLLRRSGRFLVEKGLAGRRIAVRSAVRPCTALVPIPTERKTTALVPVDVSQRTGLGNLFGNLAHG